MGRGGRFRKILWNGPRRNANRNRPFSIHAGHSRRSDPRFCRFCRCCCHFYCSVTFSHCLSSFFSASSNFLATRESLGKFSELYVVAAYLFSLLYGLLAISSLSSTFSLSVSLLQNILSRSKNFMFRTVLVSLQTIFI